MEGYFILEFDTTGPHIDVYAPKYTDRVANNTINIISNEKLSDYQDIYIVDSQGKRHDLIFSFDGDKTFSGNVTFNGYPMGVTTIYAQLKDEVGNVSNLAYTHISVITSTYNSMLRLTMAEKAHSTNSSIGERKPVSKEKEMAKIMSEDTRQLIMSEKTRAVIVSDTD
jgi:hypothetical protein